jgi:predicted permease
VVQMAISFVLLVGAVLFARAPGIILNTDTGFETRQLAFVPLDVETPPYTDTSAHTFYSTLETRMLQIPGVQTIAYASLPFYGQAPPKEILKPGQLKGQGQPATVNNVSASFFQAFNIPLLRGRSFGQDHLPGSSHAPVAIVSEAMAKAFWAANEDPIGKTVITPEGNRLTVIGIAHDTRVEHLGQLDSPRLYTLRDPAALDGTLYVRFSGDSAPVIHSIQSIIKGLDPNQLVDAPETLRKFLEEEASELKPLADIILIMASIAMIMAITGLYSVLTFAINQRRREFGIQMVLGATRQTVFRGVMERGLRQIALGLLFGTLITFPAAMTLRRLFSRSLVQINPFDPVLYIVAAALLVLVSAFAMYLPALRATQVDPIQALRNE